MFLSAAPALGTDMWNLCCNAKTIPSDPPPPPRAEYLVSQTPGSEISPPSGDSRVPARDTAVRDGNTIASPLPRAVSDVSEHKQHGVTMPAPKLSPHGGDRFKSTPPPNHSAVLAHSWSVDPATTMASWPPPQLVSITGAPVTEEPACTGPRPMPARRSKSAHPSFQLAPSSPQKEMGVADSRSGYVARRPNATIGALPNHLQSPSGTNHISTKADKSRPTLTSTVREVLSYNFRFRILVLGRSGSGKSSLMNSIFKVDMAAAQVNVSGNSDIHVGICPGDNRYLMIHECSGFEPGNSQNLQTIRDFITNQTAVRLPASERLHAIWICVPTTDLIGERLGDGVEEILGNQKVPVVLAFTKFDLLVSQVLFDIAGGDPQHHERAKARAREMCEESCRRLLRRHPKNVPAEIVSGKPEFGDLIDKLIVTTRQLLADPVTPSEAQKAKLRLPLPVHLAWSVAQRASRNVIIEASIEVGRSRYWCGLGSSPDFTNKPVTNCLDIIHADIVDVWNLRDSNQYLSSEAFKAKIRHLVQEFTGIPSGSKPNSTSGTGVPTSAAPWENGPYCGSNENVCCVMGYVVDLTVILYHVFRSSRDVSAHLVKSEITNFVRSGHKNDIHNNIRDFVTAVPVAARMHLERDVFMEKIIDLITSALQQ